MSEGEKFTVTLDAELAEFIHDLVRKGCFASTDEAIQTAVDCYELQFMDQAEIERLRRLWYEGLASGPGRLGDIEAIKAEARRRWRLEQAEEAGKAEA